MEMNRERRLREAGLEKLRQAFEMLLGLPFPPNPHDDELDDCWGELTLQDAFVAGCVSRLLEGQRRLPTVTKEDMRLDEQLVRRVAERRDMVPLESDKEAADAMLRRLRQLQDVIEIALRISE